MIMRALEQMAVASTIEDAKNTATYEWLVSELAVSWIVTSWAAAMGACSVQQNVAAVSTVGRGPWHGGGSASTPTCCRHKVRRVPVVEMLGGSPFSEQAQISPQPSGKRSATRSSPKSKLGPGVPAEAGLGSCLSSS